MFKKMFITFLFFLNIQSEVFGLSNFVVRRYFKHFYKLQVSCNIDIGSICEQIAYIEKKNKFKLGRYKIYQNVSYHSKDKTIGELDLIVFDKRKRVVKEVIEVKCSKDISSAASKSNAQLKRFKRHLKYKDNKLPEIYFKSCNNILQVHHFTKYTRFSKLTYKSVLAQTLGFELLSLGLSDMQYLTNKWNNNELPSL